MRTSRRVRSGDGCSNDRRARRSAGLIAAGIVSIVGLFLSGGVKGQATSSPAPTAPQTKAHNFAAEIVEDEAKALKAPTGFAGVKWLLNVDEVKAIRPKAIVTDADHLHEQMEWLGRTASVSYGFNDGLFVIAILTLSDSSAATFEKAQKYLQSEYGNMPAAAKTDKFLLSSTYKQGRFCIMHTLGSDKYEQVTLFRVKM